MSGTPINERDDAGSGTPAPPPEYSDAQRFARALFAAARDAGIERPVFELRVVDFATPQPWKVGGRNVGYFDHAEALANAAELLDRRGAKAVYVTLNPVVPALLARASNRVASQAREAANDADVVRRLWLLIDIDPVRPAGISSSEAEHRGALDLAGLIYVELRAQGWPNPIVGDSSNGAHILYRIDLPNDEHACELVSRVLEALAARFDTASVKVDRSVFNASRISKVYGTTARKGDNVTDRPHRLARLLAVPETLTPVSNKHLETLAASSPRPAPRPSPSTIFPKSLEGKTLDAETFISRHKLAVSSVKTGANGRKIFVLSVCPFNPAHAGDGGGGGSAVITQEPDGMLGFRCHHNSCAAHNWRALREHLEPFRRTRQQPLTKAQKIRLARETVLQRIRDQRSQANGGKSSGKEDES